MIAGGCTGWTGTRPCACNNAPLLLPLLLPLLEDSDVSFRDAFVGNPDPDSTLGAATAVGADDDAAVDAAVDADDDERRTPW